MLGTVAAGHDERGEVGVVVVRAEARRALAGLDADLHIGRAAALIALTGGLDGHRRGRDLAGARHQAHYKRVRAVVDGQFHSLAERERQARDYHLRGPWSTVRRLYACLFPSWTVLSISIVTLVPGRNLKGY